MTKQDYYDILKVRKDASKEEIKKSYKQLAKKYHPDLNKETGSEEKFKEVSEAYAVLSDDNKKQQYDQFGHAGFDQRFSQEDIFRGFNFDVFNDVFGKRDGFSNVFDMFFGGGRERQRKGSDLRYDLEIDFEEAVNGIEKEIKFHKLDSCEECEGKGGKNFQKCSKCNGNGQVRVSRRTPFGVFTQVATCSDCEGRGEEIKDKCKECRGKGRVEIEKKLKVKIPAGVDNGSNLRLRDEGEAVKGGENGDLYVVLHVKPSKVFERRGYDLFLKVPVSFSQAALGDKVEIPILGGKKKIKVDAGVQSGTILRMKDEGIKRLGGSVKGDLFVDIIVKSPEKLSKKEKELFKKLKEEESKKGFLKRLKEELF